MWRIDGEEGRREVSRMVRRLFLGVEREDEVWFLVFEEERFISFAFGDFVLALFFFIFK